MLFGGHFVLVKEIRGDKLMVNDSLKADPDALTEYSQSVDQIFASSGTQVELVWLENTKGRENEIADKFDLDYDANTGTYSFRNENGNVANAPGQASHGQKKNKQTILQKNGIETMTQLYDDVVFDSVYLPKKTEIAGQGDMPVNEEIRNEIVKEIKKDVRKELSKVEVWGFDDKEKTRDYVKRY